MDHIKLYLVAYFASGFLIWEGIFKQTEHQWMKLKFVRGLSSSFRGLLPTFLSDLLPPSSELYNWITNFKTSVLRFRMPCWFVGGLVTKCTPASRELRSSKAWAAKWNACVAGTVSLLLMCVVGLLLVTLSCSADLWRSQRSPLHEDQFWRAQLPRIRLWNIQVLLQTLTIWCLWENCFILPLASYCLCGQTIGLPVKYCFYYTNSVIKKAKVEANPLHAIRVYGASRGIAPLILNLRTRLRWVFSITLRPLYPSPMEGTSSAHWIRDWSVLEFGVNFRGTGALFHVGNRTMLPGSLQNYTRSRV
jgi:hypothetical protein